MMKFRNAQYNADGTIDCEVNHPVHGWVPFTASPSDCEAHGREIYKRCKSKAKPHVADDPS